MRFFIALCYNITKLTVIRGRLVFTYNRQQKKGDRYVTRNNRSIKFVCLCARNRNGFFGTYLSYITVQGYRLFLQQTEQKSTGSSCGGTTAESNRIGGAYSKQEEIIAAVSAAIAEELGTDVSAIRITSFKKL